MTNDPSAKTNETDPNTRDLSPSVLRRFAAHDREAADHVKRLRDGHSRQAEDTAQTV